MAAVSAQGTRRPVPHQGTGSHSLNWPKTLMQKRNAPLAPTHLRFQSRMAGGTVLYCLVLDCSASMLSGQNLALAKGLLTAWARQIYQQRAQLCVIGFGGGEARVLQAPRKAAHLNEHWIAPIAGGGGTPVHLGLQKAETILQQHHKKNPHQVTALWLLTDGRFSDLPPRPRFADSCALVDFENAPLRLGRAAQLAQHWQCEYHLAEEFHQYTTHHAHSNHRGYSHAH